jgi:hypothetical protein
MLFDSIGIYTPMHMHVRACLSSLRPVSPNAYTLKCMLAKNLPAQFHTKIKMHAQSLHSAVHDYIVSFSFSCVVGAYPCCCCDVPPFD